MTRLLPSFLVALAIVVAAGCNGQESQNPSSDNPPVADGAPKTQEGNPQTTPTDDGSPASAEQPGQTPGAQPEEKKGVETRPQPGNEQPRQPQGGNRAGGQQGFGGGMWGGGASLALRDDVRKEIGLTDDQVEKLRTKLRELVPQPGPNNERPNVNPEELAKKLESVVKSVLTPAQIKRLEELELQRSGPAALARKDVAAKAGISEETRAKIEKLVADHQSKLRGMGGPPSSQEEAQKRQEEMRAMRDKLRADILALLTADQKSKWEAMLGKPFEFQQRRQGGPGGGQQRPQGGGSA